MDQHTVDDHLLRSVTSHLNVNIFNMYKERAKYSRLKRHKKSIVDVVQQLRAIVSEKAYSSSIDSSMSRLPKGAIEAFIGPNISGPLSDIIYKDGSGFIKMMESGLDHQSFDAYHDLFSQDNFSKLARGITSFEINGQLIPCIAKHLKGGSTQANTLKQVNTVTVEVKDATVFEQALEELLDKKWDDVQKKCQGMKDEDAVCSWLKTYLLMLATANYANSVNSELGVLSSPVPSNGIASA